MFNFDPVFQRGSFSKNNPASAGWNTDGADWTDCRGFYPSLNIELQIRKSRIVESPIVEFSIRIKVMSDYKSLDRASELQIRKSRVMSDYKSLDKPSELQIRKSRIANSEEHKSSDKAISLAY